MNLQKSLRAVGVRTWLKLIGVLALVVLAFLAGLVIGAKMFTNAATKVDLSPGRPLEPLPLAAWRPWDRSILEGAN